MNIQVNDDVWRRCLIARERDDFGRSIATGRPKLKIQISRLWQPWGWPPFNPEQEAQREEFNGIDGPDAAHALDGERHRLMRLRAEGR
jgi:hypothetical protein